MRYLMLVLFLVGCSNEIDFHGRLIKEAKQLCSCHDGVDIFSFNGNAFSLLCKDGSSAVGSGNMRIHGFYSDCSK